MRLFLRVAGALGIAFGVVVLAAARVNRYAASHGGHNLQPLLSLGIICLVVGACLVVLERLVR
jgi:hypothetical protein